MSSISNANTWAGRILSGFVVLFLLFDCSLKLKLMKLKPAVEGTVQLGYPSNLLFTIGVIELFCVVVYMIPRSAVLGAILLTGYLGGAVATHLRLGNPLFTHILFPSKRSVDAVLQFEENFGSGGRSDYVAELRDNLLAYAPQQHDRRLRVLRA